MAPETVFSQPQMEGGLVEPSRHISMPGSVVSQNTQRPLFLVNHALRLLTSPTTRIPLAQMMQESLLPRPSPQAPVTPLCITPLRQHASGNHLRPPSTQPLTLMFARPLVTQSQHPLERGLGHQLQPWPTCGLAVLRELPLSCLQSLPIAHLYQAQLQ